jgi:hypothetical protein
VYLCFNWAPRHEGVLGEWRYSFTYSLTSALDGGEWSASRPGRFIPKERAPGGGVGSRAVLDAVVKRKIPSSRRESKPITPIVQPVAERYTDWAITALRLIYINIFLISMKFSNDCCFVLQLDFETKFYIWKRNTVTSSGTSQFLAVRIMVFRRSRARLSADFT